MRLSLQHVECFHLVFLRTLEVRLDRAWWVVKGGVNLRAWFGSVRYSEHLDIDLLRGSVHAVQTRVDGVLGSAAFRDLLAAQGLELTRRSKPKQTETTQRWKCEIRARGLSTPLPTKIELSRTGAKGEYELALVRPDVVRPYGLLAPTVNHYVARSTVHQKVEALARRKETQARDVWDLEHLLRTTGVDPGPFAADQRKALGEAVDRAMSLSFDVFKAQVVPYLAPEHQEIYGTPEAWDRICELVVDRLSRFLP